MRHDSVAAILARSPADDPRRVGRAEGTPPVPETGENKKFQHVRTWVVRVTDPQSGDDALDDAFHDLLVDVAGVLDDEIDPNRPGGHPRSYRISRSRDEVPDPGFTTFTFSGVYASDDQPVLHWESIGDRCPAFRSFVNEHDVSLSKLTGQIFESNKVGDH